MTDNFVWQWFRTKGTRTLGYETEKPEVLERYGIAQLRRAKNKKIN